LKENRSVDDEEWTWDEGLSRGVKKKNGRPSPESQRINEQHTAHTVVCRMSSGHGVYLQGLSGEEEYQEETCLIMTRTAKREV
jgi:hypothetical protein